MFEFKGEWNTNIYLKEFSILKNPEYNDKDSKVDQGIFNLEIFDIRNENPDPEEFQLNIIHFLLEPKNQLKILDNLLTYSRDIIYPHYKEFMWEEEYPECYPKLENKNNLFNLYGINRIIIKRIEKDDFAYFIFDCSSCLDYEHGITITLYKDEVIDHGEDWDDQKVCAHKGIDYKTYNDKAVADFNKKILEIAIPHPKYGKLKPFQADQNEYYPVGLYHAEQFERLIKELENGTIKDGERVMARLFPLSIYHAKEQITQYLLPKFGEGHHSAFKYALEKDRYDIMNQLIKQGYDINQQVAQDSTFYDSIGKLESCINKNEDFEHIIKRLKYLLENGLNPDLEDNFGRNSYYRIERIDSEEVKIRVNKIIGDIKKAPNKKYRSLGRWLKFGK